MLRTTRLASLLAAFAVTTASLSAQDSVQKSPPEPAQASAPTGNDPAAERDRLLLENQLQDETLRHALAPSTAELQKLKVENELTRARAEKELQAKRLAIDQARLEAEEIAARAALETARLEQSSQAELIRLRVARERADLDAELAQARYSQQSSEFKTQELAWKTKTAELTAKISEHEKETEADGYVDRPAAAYVKEPLLADGTLVISDRRIPLNGIITAEIAETVCTQIDFFNNKSKEYPIFIVIDDCPGGSVMAGYKILKTMQSSAAPVCVVVKSFAASMAATICTLAPRSFAYPNAIILHHQISNELHGNLASQRESVKTLGEWWRRLASPVADKMGISIEEFSQRMYAHSPTGDWQEFADEARKLNWVDNVIGGCRETAMVRNLSSQSGNWSTASANARSETAATAPEDQKSRAARALPRLNPVDCYYLYNPDGYYRAE